MKRFVRHTDKLGYVANTEFLHHLFSVNLGGLLDDAQIACNLLVEAPRDSTCTDTSRSRGVKVCNSRRRSTSIPNKAYARQHP